MKDELDGTPGYDQPFCIIGAKGRFWHGYEATRYVRASKLSEGEEPKVIENIIKTYIGIDKKALELQQRVVALEAQSHSHTDKKTNRYNKYK